MKNLFKQVFFLPLLLLVILTGCGDSTLSTTTEPDKEERLLTIATSEEYRAYAEAVRESFFEKTDMDLQAIREVLRTHRGAKFKDLKDAFADIQGGAEYFRIQSAIDSANEKLNQKYGFNGLDREDMQKIRQFYRSFSISEISREEAIQLLEHNDDTETES